MVGCTFRALSHLTDCSPTQSSITRDARADHHPVWKDQADIYVLCLY